MKTVLIHMENDDYFELLEIKGRNTWRSLLLAHIKNKKEVE